MDTWPWPLALVAGEWIIRAVLVPVIIVRQDRPRTCLTWLAATIVLPWIALVLYVLVGERSLGRRRLERRRRAHERFADAVARLESTETAADPGQRLIGHLAERVGGLPLVPGNSVQLVDGTETFVDGLINDIDHARHGVDLLFYVFKDDEVGRRVGGALSQAVRRGVRCRVLADAVGSRAMLRSMAGELESQGVRVKPLLPVSPLRRRRSRLDLRDHRKLVVVDETTAYVGSHNLERTDGEDGCGPFHDLTARVQGPIAHHVQRVFAEAWYHETGELDEQERRPAWPAPPPGSTVLQVVPSGPDRPGDEIRDVLVEAVHQARERLTITTPYFVPDDAMETALRLAALRGVAVALVVPARSDHRLVDAASEFYCSRLAGAGVRVFRHRRGMLHAKTMTVDDAIGVLGSANFDIRSFSLNFELTLLLHDRDLTRALRRFQDGYLDGAEETPRSFWARRPARRRAASHVAKLLSPLL